MQRALGKYQPTLKDNGHNALDKCFRKKSSEGYSLQVDVPEQGRLYKDENVSIKTGS